jgi:hypothetical protein
LKTTAILIPTYKRFSDLINTLQKTPIDARAKFVIVANLEEDELSYIREKFGDISIIIDERDYGKLGGCKAYNLAFEVAKDNKFDYAILFADDVMPFKHGWLNKLYKEFINTNGQFGIFSSDECHAGHYGWNLILDCPIAHFFVIDCNLVEQLFLDGYKQYVIDFEIAVRLKEQGIDIQLLSIKLKHLRSGLHREFMDNNFNHDVDTFTKVHPKYESSFKQLSNLFFVKDSARSQFISKINLNKLPPWPEPKSTEKFINRLKRKIKPLISSISLKLKLL